MHAKKKQSKVNTEKEIENKISEMLRDVQSSKTLSPEQLELWVAEDKAKKKRRFKFSMSIVCCCVLVLGVSIYGVGRFMNIGPFVATAGEDDKGKVVNVDEMSGSKDKEDSGDNNITAEQIIYEDWESIVKAKEKFPELAVPTYIPEGLEFCELVITKENKEIYYLYRWKKEKNVVELQQYTLTQLFTYGTRILDTDRGNVYVCEDDNKFVTWSFDNYGFSLLGNFSDEDICKIVEEIEI